MKKILLLVSIVSALFISLILTSCDGLDEFKFDNNYLTLNVGETKQSTTIVDTNHEVNYFSGDESIAKVDESGNVTGIAIGDATIYALFKNEHYECFVKVVSENDPSNLEIYQKDLLLTGAYERTELNPIIPIHATYYGHNTQAEFEDNMKIQLVVNFKELPDKINYESRGQQYRDNLNFFGTNLIYLLAKFNDNDSVRLFSIKFAEYFNDHYYKKTDEEIENYVDNNDPFILYMYLTNDYLSFALIEGETVIAYAYSNENFGVVKDVKKIVLLADEFINKGYNIQKLDYIKLLEKYDGVLISDELREKLKKYQNLVSIITYLAFGELNITKNNVVDDSNKQLITVSVTEDGIKKINEFTEFSIDEFEVAFKIYRDELTHYTFIDNIELDITSIVGPTHLNLKFGELKKVNDESLFVYEKNHSEYEKIEFVIDDESEQEEE